MQLAILDLVELFFKTGGKRDVEDVFKTFHQQHAYALAQHCRGEAALILFHVLAFNDGRNNRGVRGRPTDALFFQIFHQRRFGIARRRLREMLLRTNGIKP